MKLDIHNIKINRKKNLNKINNKNNKIMKNYQNNYIINNSLKNNILILLNSKIYSYKLKLRNIL